VSTRSWREESELIAALAGVNTEIGRYVLRALDADAGRDEPTSPAAEYRLGNLLVDLGGDLQARAADRSEDVRQRPPGGERTAQDATAPNIQRDIPPPWVNPAVAIYMS
jgi:hypothetical protein